MRRACLFVTFAGALALLAACTTYRDQLVRSQKAFDANEHDRTLALLRDLEPNMDRLSVPEQAQYAYLRGLTDYRIGYRADARHWLTLTKAYEEGTPGVLPADWKTNINEALDDLNNVVYAQGTSALTTERKTDEEIRQPAPRATKSKDAGSNEPVPAAAMGDHPAAEAGAPNSSVDAGK